MFRQRINQEWAWSLTSQDLHSLIRIKIFPSSRFKCKITSSKVGQAPSSSDAPKLGFWLIKAYNWLFHLEMIQYCNTWYKGLKYIFEVQSYDPNCPKGLIQWKLKIRVSPIKFHLVYKGKIGIFVKYTVSWSNIQENMVYRCIGSRLNQEIKITCKRGNHEEIEIFTKSIKIMVKCTTLHGHNLQSKQPIFVLQSPIWRPHLILQLCQWGSISKKCID